MQLQRPTTRRAFTILELLIAVFLTFTMIGVVGQLFVFTSNAVSLGANTSDVTNGARTIGEQLWIDATGDVLKYPTSTEGIAMNPPGGPGGYNIANDPLSGRKYPNAGERVGFITIINKRYTNVPYRMVTDNRTLSTGGKVSGPMAFRRSVRSDQLAFIRSADSITYHRHRIVPVTPQNSATFYNSLNAKTARVWYGHVQRINPNGTDLTAATLGTGTGLDGINSLNLYATNWILGRQAMLLHGPNFPAPPLPQTDYYVNGVYEDSQVVGHNAGLYMGVSDVSNVKDVGNAGESGTLFGPGDENPDTDDVRLDPYYLGVPAGVAPGFAERAYKLVYANRRLRVNPTPNTTDFNAKVIAQMHTYLMGNVSDFIVEFAADISPKDGRPDLDAHNNIKWYGHFYNNPIQGSLEDGTYRPEAVTVWSVPTASYPAPGASQWPFPIYDVPNDPIDFPNVDAAFMWRPMAGLTSDRRRDGWFLSSPPLTLEESQMDNWPFLIRVRFRLHDQRGRLRGITARDPVENAAVGIDDQGSGRWFEQVIPVHR